MDSPIKKLRKVTGDHDYSLSSDFGPGLRITQSQYFRAGKFVIAVGELNKPNRWDDEAFDEVAAFMQRAWNDAEKARTVQQEARLAAMGGRNDVG